MEQGEIILYQPDEIIKLEVHLKNEKDAIFHGLAYS